jgi:hypothetical protein
MKLTEELLQTEQKMNDGMAEGQIGERREERWSQANNQQEEMWSVFNRVRCLRPKTSRSHDIREPTFTLLKFWAVRCQSSVCS